MEFAREIPATENVADERPSTLPVEKEPSRMVTVTELSRCYAAVDPRHLVAAAVLHCFAKERRLMVSDSARRGMNARPTFPLLGHDDDSASYSDQYGGMQI